MTDSNHIKDSGASTDQHVTGNEEEGAFTTDQPPTGETPARTMDHTLADVVYDFVI